MTRYDVADDRLDSAYDGRASHGLYSLLKEPAYKRTLFIIHTSDWWMNTVIVACLIHASLIVVEPPNFQWAWSRIPWIDPWWALVVEMLCILVFVCDVVFKMLYFGGWKDYVSKEWQRYYLALIFLFLIDFLLYNAKLLPLRFARPVRLLVLGARHRDVRRLISFFPTMCIKLVVAFAVPLLGVTMMFAVFMVRLYGRLPKNLTLELGEDRSDDD